MYHRSGWSSRIIHGWVLVIVSHADPKQESRNPRHPLSPNRKKWIANTMMMTMHGWKVRGSTIQIGKEKWFRTSFRFQIQFDNELYTHSKLKPKAMRMEIDGTRTSTIHETILKFHHFYHFRYNLKYVVSPCGYKTMIDCWSPSFDYLILDSFTSFVKINNRSIDIFLLSWCISIILIYFIFLSNIDPSFLVFYSP